jgi:alkyl hydroperoxide reductase subunit AhpF
MALISPSDQQKLRESFAEMTRPVRLLFFTQTLGCETCLQTRQILDELTPLTDRITIEEVNLILEADKAKEYGVDRAPALAITYQEGSAGSVNPASSENPWRDSRIRFLGAPAGYEFISLVQAVLLAGGRASRLSEQSLQAIAAVNQPVTLRVFTTPT